MRKLSCLLLAACAAGSLNAQDSPDLKQVVDRLDRLEIQNRELMAEIKALREQLAANQQSPATTPETSPQTAETAPSPQPVAERAAVNEQRIADLDQSKVGSDHRLPVTLTGMLLFNTFLNGKGAGGADNPTVLSPTAAQASGGATFRQSVIGLKVDGPSLVGGGKVTGAVYMDFFGGGTGLNQTVRLRIAKLDATWKNTTLGIAFDKPIIAPREPDSLAQVGVSPLTGAGNLWLWQPQVRVEQRISFTEQAGLRAQFGVYQTSESGTGLGAEYPGLAKARPGYQGRVEFWAKSGSRRIEIAPGFHLSSTRVLGQSVPSRIASFDWLIRPAARVDFTGTFFHGENVGVIGGLRQGVSVIGGQIRAVQATGGWGQFTFRATQRVSFNVFGGQEDDRNRDLEPGGIGKNQAYGANIMYRLGSNILTSIESSQVRTTYLGSRTLMNPHYDLAFAYLF
ncbi:MAG TPA: hypothetical protein VGQ49_24235 [Bryobacteraceae bacterium]|jgi:hypothetical protein|nr:hypothetical protein [Bryobacteraceae bacterium]